MIKRTFVLSFLFAALGLNGCSRSILDTNDARCPFTDKGGCQSMEMVNRMVTEKRFTPDGQFVQQAPMYRRPQSSYQK